MDTQQSLFDLAGDTYNSKKLSHRVSSIRLNVKQWKVGELVTASCTGTLFIK